MCLPEEVTTLLILIFPWIQSYMKKIFKAVFQAILLIVFIITGVLILLPGVVLLPFVVASIYADIKYRETGGRYEIERRSSD